MVIVPKEKVLWNFYSSLWDWPCFCTFAAPLYEIWKRRERARAAARLCAVSCRARQDWQQPVCDNDADKELILFR